jgi:hypothetical protein
MCWSCGHVSLKQFWCACKNVFMACMNLLYLSCGLYCGVHVYLICLVICDDLCLLIIINSCRNDHTCVGTPQNFCQGIWLSSQVYILV